MSGIALRLAAATGVAALLAAVPGPGLAQNAGRSASTPCSVLQVRNSYYGGLSSVSTVDLAGLRRTPAIGLGHRVNALGYAREQGLAYGMSSAGQGGTPWRRGHVVTIDRDGRLTDLGPLRGSGTGHPLPADRLADASSATVAGARWYLGAGSVLYTVDINPGSPDFLRVTARTPLYPRSLGAALDDVDLDPADGLLYGMAATPGGGVPVRLDPGTGRVRPLPGPQLPASSAFGAVTIADAHTLYVTANQTGGRSRLYRVDLDGGYRLLGSGAPLAGTDATGCLVRTAPAPTPPGPTPPVSTPPPPATSPATTPPSGTPPPATGTSEPPPPTSLPPPQLSPLPPLPSPVTAPPVRVPVRPAVTPPAPPARTTPSSPVTGDSSATPAAGREPPPVAPSDTGRAQRQRHTETKRRWGVTTLVLIIGGCAAARQLRRR